DGAAAPFRRRALRQALLVRLKYQDLAVPPLPTSPGENARVLPAPFFRVAHEQIVEVGKRRERLFRDRPFEDLVSLVPRPLRVALFEDLSTAAELTELGMAVFLDRPLGADHPAGAPDQTPLFSHNAFSRSIALERLHFLQDSLAPCCDVKAENSWGQPIEE